VSGEFSIETFRGDYEALERMAHASWRDEYGGASFPNFYRPAFLRFLFERIPAGKKEHLIAAYRGGEIAAFLANLPRRYYFDGRLVQGVYSCLLVTRREHLRRGLALAVIRAAIEQNRRHGYDFALLTLETGHRSSKMMAKIREEGNRIERIRKAHVIARILDLKRVSFSEGLKPYERAAIVLLGSHRPPRPDGRIELRPYRPADLEACHGLLDRYRESVRLALAWDKADLAVELDCPDVSRTLIYERDGRAAGMINFLLHDHIGRTTERWAWINHVAFPDLTPSEQYDFIQAYMRHIRDMGCAGTIEWTKNYYPLRAFRKSRFFPYPRGVNWVSWTFNPELSLAGLPGLYEVQI